MKPERALIAERMLAQHCPELLRAGPAPAELLPHFARLGERLARGLASALAPLTGGEPPLVTSEAPRECSLVELSGDFVQLAANSLLALGAQATPLLASLEAQAVLRLVDRAFGGRGDAPSPLPEAFPLSAQLMIERLEALTVSAIAEAFGGAANPLRRSASLYELAPFAGNPQLAVLAINVEEEDRTPWRLTLALPLDGLAMLFGHGDGTRAPAPSGESDPSGETFGGVPLTLSAVLVDMPFAVSALSLLEPGQIIPVAVARSVPLRIGGRTIAHGTAGATDERVAIQITQAF